MNSDRSMVLDEESPFLPHTDTERNVSAQRYTDEGLEFAVENTGVTLLESTIVDEPEEGESDEIRWLRENRLNHQKMKWWSRPSLIYLCVILSAVGLTDTLTIAPYTLLSMRKICESIAQSNDEWGADGSPICNPSKVQEKLSGITSIVFLINGIAGTLLSGKLGELSDRFGRVPIFIYIASIKAVGLIIMLCVFYTKNSFPRTLFIIGQCVPSFGGSVITLIANGNSYISDITEPELRPIYISFLMSTIYGSMGLGPFLSSLLVKSSGGNNLVPIWLALGLAGTLVLVCLFIMSESRHEMAKLKSQTKFMKRRQSIDSIRSQSSGTSSGSNRPLTMLKYTFLQFFDFFSPVRKLWIAPTAAGSLVPRYMVLLLVGIDVIFVISTAAAVPTIILAFVFMFGWGSEQLGYFVSFLGLGKAAALLFMAPLILHLLKKKFKTLPSSIDYTDMIILRVSVVFILLSLVALVTIKSESSAYIFVFFQILASMLSPTIQSTVVKYGSKSATGELFGAMALIRSFAMMVLPSMFLKVYSKTVKINPLFFIYIPLVLSVAACIMTLFLKVVDDPELLRRQSEVVLTRPDVIPPKSNGNFSYDSAPKVAANSRRESSAQSLRIPVSR
ncbi:unnamed protein product [Kluyveromyces dobzhanskii CBS 2104]|uniref:WGS project CCBQ000000000 data, contig 00016 n=1 Tax=Kluyveromyces dobzhanskii CBS 2104 TaxID=1427455 RepID=A0A0A8KZZ6_9SACH|nr:unnamed protein product [Kluyveromyces dobzhanskii CBS 2104]